MQAGKLVEKSLHRHQSHFSNKSPAAGGEGTDFSTAKSKTTTFIQWNIVLENKTTTRQEHGEESGVLHFFPMKQPRWKNDFSAWQLHHC